MATMLQFVEIQGAPSFGHLIPITAVKVFAFRGDRASLPGERSKPETLNVFYMESRNGKVSIDHRATGVRPEYRFNRPSCSLLYHRVLFSGRAKYKTATGDRINQIGDRTGTLPSGEHVELTSENVDRTFYTATELYQIREDYRRGRVGNDDSRSVGRLVKAFEGGQIPLLASQEAEWLSSNVGLLQGWCGGSDLALPDFWVGLPSDMAVDLNTTAAVDSILKSIASGATPYRDTFSEVDGEVTDIEVNGLQTRITVTTLDGEEAYYTPGFEAMPLVKVGSQVRRGRQLFDVFSDVPVLHRDNPRRLRTSLYNRGLSREDMETAVMAAGGIGSELRISDNRTVTLYPVRYISVVAVPNDAVVLVDRRTLGGCQLLHNGAISGRRGVASWDLRTSRRISRWEDLPEAQRKLSIATAPRRVVNGFGVPVQILTTAVDPVDLVTTAAYVSSEIDLEDLKRIVDQSEAGESIPEFQALPPNQRRSDRPKIIFEDKNPSMLAKTSL